MNRSTGLLVGALAVSMLLALGLGAVRIDPYEIIAILARRVGLDAPWSFEPQQEIVLTSIRVPRALLGALVGAAMASSGAALQGLVRNPLADPVLVGITSGAALGAAAAIVLAGRAAAASTSALFATWTVPAAAFAGALLSSWCVVRLSRGERGRAGTTILLAGIAIGALASSGIGVLTYIATDAELRNLAFWNLGSLGGATWSTLAVAGPLLLLGVLALPSLARALNLILLGESEARHLGVSVDGLKRRVVLLVALLVGASVAACGAIAFVGLVAPHLARHLVGPDHRALLPAAALIGAVLVLLSDVVARTVVAPAELPLGTVTSAFGAPFFLALLLRERRRAEAAL